MASPDFPVLDYSGTSDNQRSNFAGADFPLPPDMKEIIRKSNIFFVSIILVFFYFIAIGLTFVVKKLFFLRNKQGEKSSYWLNIDESKSSLKDFESAY